MAQVIGARLGLTTYTAGTDPRPGRTEHNAERALLEALVVVGSQGTESARPTAGKGRALYWHTERGTLQWDTGNGWNDISVNGGGGPGRAILVGGTPVEGTSDRSARADHTHSVPLVTTTTHGAMSSTDKTKLDNAVSAATASRLIIRDAAGRAQVASPSAAADIANKGYVDSIVGGAAAPVVSADNNGLATPAMLAATGRVDSASVVNTGDTLVVRDAAGRTQVSTPASPADAAPKSYVDGVIASHRHDASHITTGTLTAARLPVVTTTAHGAMLNTDKVKLDGATDLPNASTLVMRTSAGTYQAATPVNSGDVATKGYVDTGLGAKAATNHTHDASQVNTGTMAATRLPYASATADGILSAANYNLLQNHGHDASAIVSGTLGAARIPLATTSAPGGISSTLFDLLSNATTEAVGSTLMKRWGTGVGPNVENPDNPMAVANKRYVDSLQKYSSRYAEGDAIMIRWEDGTGARVNDPKDQLDTANKRYVDGKGTPNPTGGKFIERWSNGSGGHVNDPSTSLDVTNQRYVLSKVSRRAWKTNPRDLPYRLAEVRRLGSAALLYDYKDTEEAPESVRGKRDQLGAYVEDVATIMPLLAWASEEDGEPERIEDRALIWPALASISDLADQQDDLDARLTRVEEALGLSAQKE